MQKSANLTKKTKAEDVLYSAEKGFLNIRNEWYKLNGFFSSTFQPDSSLKGSEIHCCYYKFFSL